jgi:predicted MPP superfamily phosphohydrolase
LGFNLLIKILEILIVLIIVCAVIGICNSIYNSKRFIIRKYNVKSSKLKKSLRICHLSDIHGWQYGDDNKNLIKAIDELNPDIIVFSGDILTGSSPRKTWPLEKGLVRELASRYPVYAANGNHESELNWYYEGFGQFYDTYINDMSSFGVNLLNNDKMFLDEYGIRITGLELPHEYFRKVIIRRMKDDYLDSMIGKPDEDRFNLLIAHNPQYFPKYAKWGADLVLSGHIHGGIIKLPLLGGVISPALILFPKYDGGLFKIGGHTMVLSRGLGTHTIPIRVFNPGELVVIDLEADNGEAQ